MGPNDQNSEVGFGGGLRARRALNLAFFHVLPRFAIYWSSCFVAWFKVGPNDQNSEVGFGGGLRARRALNLDFLAFFHVLPFIGQALW